MRQIFLVWIYSIALLLGQTSPLKTFYSFLDQDHIVRMEVDFYQKQFDNSYRSSGFFYLIGKKNYVYELRCELVRYEDEGIDTGIDEIDNELVGDETDGTSEDGISTILGPSQTLTMVGTGVTAAAYTGIITAGGVHYINVTNRGGGYITPPSVGISSAPSGGVTGILTSYMIGGIQYCNLNVNEKAKSVQGVRIVNPGAGYATTTYPGIAFTSTTGTGAAGTAFAADGTLGIVTVTASGGGFTTAPTVTLPTPLAVTKTGIGTTATGVAIIGPSGTVSEVRYTNAGSGYTTGDLPISVTIQDPESDGSGDFIFNETVTGGTSEATARVRTWNSTTNILEVASVVGSFVIGETLTGSSSGATHDLRLLDEDPLDDGFADNTQIETSADAILDFTEQNPFGTP